MVLEKKGSIIEIFVGQSYFLTHIENIDFKKAFDVSKLEEGGLNTKNWIFKVKNLMEYPLYHILFLRSKIKKLLSPLKLIFVRLYIGRIL